MSNVELVPIDLAVTHNFSGSDTRQVPAAGATVTAAREGATAVLAATCPANVDTTVKVGNVGRFAIGDLLTLNATTGLLWVRAVNADAPPNDSPSLILRNITPGGTTMNVAVGNRLVAGSLTVSATVSVGATCPSFSITDVVLRAPQAGDVFLASGSSTQRLQVISVASDGLSVTLQNLQAQAIQLRAWTTLVWDSGYVLLTVTEDKLCAPGVNISVGARMATPADGTTVYPQGDVLKPLVASGYDDQARKLSLANNTGGSITVSAGDLLQPRATLPLYSDASGRLPLTLNQATLDARGAARFYTPETRVDCVATGGGLTATLLLPDRRSGWMRGGVAWVNAKDYPSIHDAIAALPGVGGVVYIPTGNYVLPYGRPLVLNRAITLEGDGPGRTVLFADQQGTTTAVQVRNPYCRIESLSITQNGSPSSGSAIGIDVGSPDLITYQVTLRHLTVNNMAGGGIKFRDTITGLDYSTNTSLVEDVLVQGTRSGDHFYVGKGCTTIVFRQCQARPSDSGTPPTGVLGFRIVNAANITLDTCEVNPPDQYSPAIYAMQSGGGGLSDKGANLLILNGDFEQAADPASDGVALVRIDGYSHAMIQGCLFFGVAPFRWTGRDCGDQLAAACMLS